MNDEIIFLLDFPEAKQLLHHIVTVCAMTIEECQKKGAPAPAKFSLGLECAASMLTMSSVGRLTFRAMMDVIGGYYSATKLHCEKHGGDPIALEDAKVLMKFAFNLDRKAKEAGWELE